MSGKRKRLYQTARDPRTLSDEKSSDASVQIITGYNPPLDGIKENLQALHQNT